MANNVYANGREIACKSGEGKTIAAFPDTCFTPPENPATPPGVPIPYPITGFDADSTEGTKTVKISGKEIIEKNESFFKKIVGDDAAQTAKKGVITSVIQGKLYFKSWSMDVKFDGVNVVRHMDLTTLNHASDPGQTPPWAFLDTSAFASPSDNPCKKEQEKEESACKDLVVRRDTKKGPNTGAILLGETKAKICEDNNKAKKCREAQKCKLIPQKEGCCPNSGQEAHHIVESHGFCEAGSRDNLSATALPQFQGSGASPGYQPGEAPCVCAQGKRAEAEHGAFHALVGKRENAAIRKAGKAGANKEQAWTYKNAKDAGINAHKKIFPKSKCSKKCLEAQLDAYHNKIGATDSTPLRTETAGLSDWQTKSDNAVLRAMKKHLRTNSGP